MVPHDRTEPVAAGAGGGHHGSEVGGTVRGGALHRVWLSKLQNPIVSHARAWCCWCRRWTSRSFGGTRCRRRSALPVSGVAARKPCCSICQGLVLLAPAVDITELWWDALSEEERSDARATGFVPLGGDTKVCVMGISCFDRVAAAV